MIDRKDSIPRCDAYRTRRDLAAAALVALSIWGAASVSELTADNSRLQRELLENLSVSCDAADYMTHSGAGKVFSEQDLE
jgi:hypothetical protein